MTLDPVAVVGFGSYQNAFSFFAFFLFFFLLLLSLSRAKRASYSALFERCTRHRIRYLCASLNFE
jgi:hypothetical protein